MAVDLQRRALLGLGLLWLGGGSPALAAVDVGGVWSTQERTGSNGINGDQVIFAGSHAIYLTDAALTDATYEVDGNKLAITPVDERLGPTMVWEFKVKENKLTMTQAGGKPLVMTRASRKPLPDADPIVGEWSARLSGERRFIQRFSRNGSTQFVLPLDIDRGSYHITGETLYMELARRGALALTVRREGNLLITRNADGVETKFVKFVY